MATTTTADRLFDLIGAAWMEGDTSGLDEGLAPDVKYHMPPIGDFDRAGVAAFIAGFRQAFTDFRVFLDETIVEGDRVLWRWHCQADFTGESPVIPIPPNGRPTAATGTIVAHLSGDRVVELWHHGDWLTWLQVPLG